MAGKTVIIHQPEEGADPVILTTGVDQLELLDFVIGALVTTELARAEETHGR